MCVCNIVFLKIEDACGLGPDLELPPELTRVIDIMIITRNRRARAFQLLEYQMGGGRLYLTNQLGSPSGGGNIYYCGTAMG